MNAIVLAAGKGNRLRSEEHDLPKVMRLANGRPLLSYVLGAIDFIPPRNTIIVVGYRRESVAEYAGNGYRYAVQDAQLGTGHAVKCARDEAGTDGDMMICCGDMPLVLRETYEGAVRGHTASGNDLTVVTALTEGGAHYPYGRIIRENGEISGIVERKDCSPEELMIPEYNAAIYIARAKPLFECLELLRNENAQGEYYLTDIVGEFIRLGLRVGTFSTYDANEIFGVNTPEDLEFCERVLKERGSPNT